jgi:SAM-dependent methyltransferase
MDPVTVSVYEQQAGEWLRRRGSSGDGLGRRFRLRTGEGRVLDAGCGAGRYLSELGSPLVGMDATFAMLSLARASGYPLVQGDLEALPFGDGSFAGLFARNSYLHVPKTRLVSALSEARRVLRPAGALLATFIEGSYEGSELPGDDFPGRFFACWQAGELARVLVAAGFGDVEVARVDRGTGKGERRDLVASGRR